ncbi:class I SAM-dependent methyltransferase [Candidatus Nitrospira bockiana]
MVNRGSVANERVPESLGEPRLVAEIAAEIQSHGPIPFARFMELALYHPTLGYYMRLEPKGDAEEGADLSFGEDRIGWGGDYYTSSDVSPVWAQCLLTQVAQIDELLARPAPFTLVEMGAGKGSFARDFLAACQTSQRGLFERLRYVIVERSPAMQRSQHRLLAPWHGEAGRVTWLGSLGELGSDSVVGVLFSNELVDALPVHRVRIVSGEPKEAYVDYADGAFRERLQPLSTPRLERYLARLTSQGIVLGEGACAEINLHAVDWIEAVARVLRRGFVITVDYGHSAADLYSRERGQGTLICYYHQMASDDPYRRVGLQDMTAHVDFSALAEVGEAAGLSVTGFTNQMSFLMGLGIEQVVERLEPGTAAFQSVVQLFRPDRMGKTFKILIQRKGVDAPNLDGLRYKPFFESALRPTGSAESVRSVESVSR